MPTNSPDMKRLIRWEAAGGAWRLLRASDDEVEIALLTCDAGEVMDVIVSRESDLREHVANSSSDADDDLAAG